MKDSALNRWMWLIGLVAVALLFVSFGPLSSGQPKETKAFSKSFDKNFLI